MRAFFLSLTAFLTVTITVYLALVIGVLTYWEMTGYQDREGAGSMGLIFILGPGLALPLGLIGDRHVCENAQARRSSYLKAPA